MESLIQQEKNALKSNLLLGTFIKTIMNILEFYRIKQFFSGQKSHSIVYTRLTATVGGRGGIATR